MRKIVTTSLQGHPCSELKFLCSELKFPCSEQGRPCSEQEFPCFY
jgi:hypothetical protein